MAWYDESNFYHIYPLGMCGAPFENKYEEPVHRLRNLFPWIDHIKNIGCNAIYIGPLFESVGHGYETTDYRKLDSRLGTNDDLKEFVRLCHEKGIRVIFDGVFNHVGRDFFAFKDLKNNRENSPYKDWFCNVNFWGNNEYNDGFSYDNWGGYNLLVKLNQYHPDVRNYLCDVIRFWVSEFDVDGIRLDAADVLAFDFMKALRQLANEVKPDFWLMGEVIHGDYTRWVNEGTLHSVTNYHLHKALFSGHNDHNFFEIAHTVKRLYGMGGNRPEGLKLYNFVDNHDVERIYTKLSNKTHFYPVHVLMYTLPGIPSIYYGSEFAIEGKKEKWSDASLRPCLNFEEYENARKENPYMQFVKALGEIRLAEPAFSYGDYNEVMLTNRQYAYSRNWNGRSVLVTVNNDDNHAHFDIPVGNAPKYYGALSKQIVPVNNGRISVDVPGNYGEIWLPLQDGEKIPENTVSMPSIPAASKKEEKPEKMEPVAMEESNQPDTTDIEKISVEEKDSTDEKMSIKQESPTTGETPIEQSTPSSDETALKNAFEEGKIAGLQEAIIAIMEKNGYVTDQMRRDVYNNTHHDSLINWVKSFR